MRGFLLDTHIWVWALIDRARLSPPVQATLEREATALWLSPLSVFEAHVLCERGRIETRGGAPEWIRAAIDAMPLTEAPVTFDIVRRSRLSHLSLRDPVDRLLVATAAELELTLITADRRIARTRECEVLENRRRRR